MSVERDNVIQAFGWFKDLMDADIDAKLAGLSYTLPAATEYNLGGVKVGDGLGMDADDRLNVTISGGESNVIEAITVDGTIQPVTNKTAALNLSAFAKKTDVANALSSISSLSLAINSLKVGDTNVIEAIKVDGTIQPPDASKTVNLNLGLSSFAKKTEVASGVRMKGSVDFFSDLANMPETPAVGDLYNIKSAGGTDGDGTPILAGDNVVYTDKGTWDVMAGFIDTSRFVEKVAGKQLSSNDFTNADKAKLDSLSNATNYTLPAATITERGGIRPGVGLTMRKNVGGVGYTDVLDCTFGNDFAIASATTDGMSGLVPKPYAGQQDEFLKAGAGWHTLPLATKDKKGCVRVGAGLSMAGEDLYVTLESGGSYDDFTGATSIAGGASGLVPAPLAGADSKFLCGNGKWEDIGKHVSIVNTGGSTGIVVGTDPTAVQGALWMDYTSDGTLCLKLRRDDYEYNFIPDSSNYKGSALPALDTSVKGQIYYLDTTPSTVNGGLWYEMEGETPKLAMRYGNNIIFDNFYYPDTSTYKGGADGLVAYVSCSTDIVENIVPSSVVTMTKGSAFNATPVSGTSLLGGTGITTSNDYSANNKLVFAKHYFTYSTVDFWFTLLPGATSVSATTRIALFGNKYIQLAKDGTFKLQVGTKFYPISDFVNTPHHVALLMKNNPTSTYVNFDIALDGNIVESNLSSSSRSEISVHINKYMVINKIRVFDKLLWDTNLTKIDIPTIDDYT